MPREVTGPDNGAVSGDMIQDDLQDRLRAKVGPTGGELPAASDASQRAFESRIASSDMTLVFGSPDILG